MNDIAQVQLAEPEKMNWDAYDSGQSKYQVPPQAFDASGNPVVFYGKVESAVIKPSDFAVDENGKFLLNYLLDPLVIVQPADAKGYIVKFTEASVKKFEKNGKVVDASKLGNYLRACGATTKPQTNDEYVAAVKAVLPKVFGFVADWKTSKNKDTGEQIKGFASFPDDPEHPGFKKAILKAGDFYNILDSKGKPTGQTAQVKSEVLFANLYLRYFRDPAKGK